MQYYRLWIYSCNVVLGITSAIFIIFAAFLLADVRFALLEGVELYHPTFFYAYGALILQCGVVQTIGCLGAKRLSKQLLSLYWSLLLLLTLGDIGVGLYWVFHLEKVKFNLRPYLAQEFIDRYSTDESFTLKWNRLQSQDRCCGVNGPLDFEKFSTSQLQQSQQSAYTANSHVIVGVETGLLSLPESCCTLLYVPTTVSSSSSSGSSLDKTYRVSNYPTEEEYPPYNDHGYNPASSIIPNDEHYHHPSDFGGSGRRSRTLARSGLIQDDDDEEEEEEEDNEVKTQVHVDYVEDAPYQESHWNSQEQSVVPENKPVPQTKSVELDPSLQKRDITSYEPIHEHKVRHELHRKSQPSSLIDVKLINVTSYVERSGRKTNANGREVNEVRETSKSGNRSSLSSRNRYNDSAEDSESSGEIHKTVEVIDEDSFVPHHHHHHRSHKTNKLFPSITFRVRRERRERRALSVTQVPAASAPIQKRIVCHEQPEGLNHHNSHKKDFPDQKKTRDVGLARTASNIPGADWLYRRTTNRRSKPTTTKELEPSAEAERSSNIQKIDPSKSESRTRRESLLAIGSIEKVMTTTPSHSPDSLSSRRRKGTTSREIKKRVERQIRNVKTSGESDSDFPTHSHPQSPTFTQADQTKPVIPGHSSAGSYYSSLPASSSTSYLEANYPHAPIISPSTAPNDQDGKGNNDTQKTLYVYGVGCGVKLIEWVDHVSGILFILGFCIIFFVKTCFLVILRTEIREMIEKMHMIEPEEVVSPSRNHSKDLKFHVSHPLLQNPHRSSTVSAHGALLPTIKSPDGPSTSFLNAGVIGGYNRPNRHYLRRASNIVGGDRSRSHSNETVNMTLLMSNSHTGESHSRDRLRSNPNLSSTGGSCGTIHLDEKDPVSGLSITVPSGSTTCSSAVVGAARYLRRSSTCTSSANPYYPYGYGFDGEPRAGPSSQSRFYQYFEPLYQPPHLYQPHHHHHYTRNRSHSRNMSCGAILPLASYRSNSTAGAISYRGPRYSSATSTTASNIPSSGGYTFNPTSREENEMIISVSLEHIASSDQDEDPDVTTAASTTLAENDEEVELEQEKKDWASATSNLKEEVKEVSKVEDPLGTKLQTFALNETPAETIDLVTTTSGTPADREFQRRNGNNNLNNVDLTNALPRSYIGTAV